MAIKLNGTLIDGDTAVVFPKKDTGTNQQVTIVKYKNTEVYRYNTDFKAVFSLEDDFSSQTSYTNLQQIGTFTLSHYTKNSNGDMQKTTETISLPSFTSSKEPYEGTLALNSTSTVSYPINFNGKVYPPLAQTTSGSSTIYSLLTDSQLQYQVNIGTMKNYKLPTETSTLNNTNYLFYFTPVDKSSTSTTPRLQFLKVTSGNVYPNFTCNITLSRTGTNATEDLKYDLWSGHTYNPSYTSDNSSYTQINPFYVCKGCNITFSNCKYNSNYRIYVDGKQVTSDFSITINNVDSNSVSNILSKHITYKKLYNVTFYRQSETKNGGYGYTTTVTNETTGDVYNISLHPSIGNIIKAAEGDVLSWVTETSTNDYSFAENSFIDTKNEIYTMKAADATIKPSTIAGYRITLNGCIDPVNTGSYVELCDDSTRLEQIQSFTVSETSQVFWVPCRTYYPITGCSCYGGSKGYRYCYSYSLASSSSKFSSLASLGSCVQGKVYNYGYTSSTPTSSSQRISTISSPVTLYIPQPPYSVAARAVLRISGGTYHDWFSWGNKKATGYSSNTPERYGMEFYACSSVSTTDVCTSNTDDADVSKIISGDNLEKKSGNKFSTGTTNGYTFPSGYYFLRTSDATGGLGDICACGNQAVRVPSKDAKWTENQQNQTFSGNDIKQNYGDHGNNVYFGSYDTAGYCTTFYVFSNIRGSTDTENGSLYYLLADAYSHDGESNYGTMYIIMMQPTFATAWTNVKTEYNAYL